MVVFGGEVVQGAVGVSCRVLPIVQLEGNGSACACVVCPTSLNGSATYVDALGSKGCMAHHI